MREWHYIEEDGNPKKAGFYLVACETYVSFSDNSDRGTEEGIRAYDDPYYRKR